MPLYYLLTMKFAYTYIMTNVTHTVLYTGCTNDLVRRVSKIEIIEEKNPEWKELVTEKGFIYDKTPWSEKVKQVMDDLIKEQ